MRTLAIILLGAGLVGAEETAKPPAAVPPPSPLKTAERMALSKLIADRGEIEKQITAIITEGCEARSFPTERCKLREDGQFVVTPLAAPEKKK